MRICQHFHDNTDSKLRAIEHRAPEPRDTEQDAAKEGLDHSIFEFEDVLPPEDAHPAQPQKRKDVRAATPDTPIGNPFRFHPDDRLAEDMGKSESEDPPGLLDNEELDSSRMSTIIVGSC